jgi:hypothetical protein
MRLRVLKVNTLALALVCAVVVQARAASGTGNNAAGGVAPVQQSVAAAQDASVSLCVESGDVTVRGWERGEVRATAAGASRVELRRTDASAGQSPASRVEVLTVGAGESVAVAGGCNHTGGTIILDVPRGSFVQVKSYSGKIEIEGVAGARVETLGGDMSLRGITKSVDATSANGVISVRASKGRVRLVTISGVIEAEDVGAAEAGDDFSAKTTTGDISLARISNAQVEASTANGSIELSGALARGGLYALHSQTGSLTLTLPADSSFLVSAKVSYGGEIITDLPLRQVPKKSTGTSATGEGGIFSTGRLTGIYGKSDAPDATLSLVSANGTIHLRKAGATAR